MLVDDFLKTLSISDYGSFASILGLLISILTLILISKLKSKLIFQTKIEEHGKSLESISSEITDFLREFESNKDNIIESFSIAKIKLRSLKKDAKNQLLEDIESIERKIDELYTRHWKGDESVNDKEIRKLLTDLNMVIEEMQNTRKELALGR